MARPSHVAPEAPAGAPGPPNHRKALDDILAAYREMGLAWAWPPPPGPAADS